MTSESEKTMKLVTNLDRKAIEGKLAEVRSAALDVAGRAGTEARLGWPLALVLREAVCVAGRLLGLLPKTLS